MKVAVVAVVCLLQFSGVAHGANPNYSYHVKIDDPAHINFQEKAETRKGEDAKGFYSVLEPNGALRTVTYIADERGFNPIVSYSYGHPQSSVTVQSATGPAAILQKTGVYAPAYVSDNRVQIVDKSNIYAVPPPALNLQTFALPGPSSPVIVPQPLRQVAPVVTAAAAITANYAPAYVPPPRAYLPPPQPQYVSVAAPPPPPPPVYSVAQALPVPQPQVVAVQQPQVLAYVDQPPPPPAVFAKFVRPSKVLTVPAAVAAVKVVKSTPTVAIVKDSYSEAPRDTYRDPNSPSYPDAVKVSEPVPEYGPPPQVREPTAEYGPPSYLPPPPLSEVRPAVKVRVVQPKVKVIQPVVQQQVFAPPPQQFFTQKVVVPQQAVQVQAVAPPAVALNPGLYAGAIGYHTHTVQPDSYVHAYGTQGFQVTSSRKFNKGFLSVPQQQVYTQPAVAVQKVVQPAPVYGPPAVAVQKFVQPAPVYGPPAVAVQKVVQQAAVYGPPAVTYQKAVQPVYGPPPAVNVVHHQQLFQKQVVQAAPPPQLHQYAQAPPPAAIAVSAPQYPVAVPAPVVQAAPTVSLTGKKQNPLTFQYSYDQGGAKVSHSYSGSGW